MKRMISKLIAAIVLCCVASGILIYLDVNSKDVAVKSEESEKWTVWLADGKNDKEHVDLIPSKTPLDNYGENMVLIHH